MFFVSKPLIRKKSNQGWPKVYKLRFLTYTQLTCLLISHLLPSMILAQISAPTPNWGQPPSTVTRWLVFITLVSILSTSIGRMVRRLITWHTDRQEVVNRSQTTRRLRQVSAITFVYLTLDPFLGEDGGSVQAVADVPGMRDDSDVTPWNTERRRKSFKLGFYCIEGRFEIHKVRWSEECQPMSSDEKKTGWKHNIYLHHLIIRPQWGGHLFIYSKCKGYFFQLRSFMQMLLMDKYCPGTLEGLIKHKIHLLK